MVVAYKVGWLTYALAKPFMHVSYMVLVNLVLGRKAIPEFVQYEAAPKALAAALKPLLRDERARANQMRDLEEGVRAFGMGQEAPSLRTARAVLELAEGK
jgi:lipid-A-disaccharide synthase